MIHCLHNNKKISPGFLILFFTFYLYAYAFAAESDVNDTNEPVIGKSTDLLYFEEDVVSANIQVWNAGTGILYYTIDINGPYANYFTIDDVNEVNGQSTGVSDKKTHTIDVNYGSLRDVVLNARVVITDINDVNSVAYITLLAQAPEEEPNEPNETPGTSLLIGKSTNRIVLSGNVASKKFQIWNKSSGTLEYTAAITEGEDYFTVTPEEGQSEGPWDKQTHTVTVDYNEVVDACGHGGTVYGEIELTDNNNDTSYIRLIATETVATHVFYIAIEQGFNFGISPTYDFYAYIETDATVDAVDFNTPERPEELLPMDYTESEDGTIRYWTYLEEFNNVDELYDYYGDGRYTFFVTYDDSEMAQTRVNFGIPNKPGTIVWPTQEPILIKPLVYEQTVSPVRLEWEKCIDPNASNVRLFLDNVVDDEIVNSIQKQYSKTTTRTPRITLDVGQWFTTLSFGRWYQAENDDDIEYEVGKCTRSYSEFEIMKWFGTFDTSSYRFRNHPLKITDCNSMVVTFNLTGGGWGEIDDPNCTFSEINLYDTTEKSVFSIKTADNNAITVDTITADGDIKAIIARKANLASDMTISGGVSSITLNDVSGNIGIGQPFSLKLSSCNCKFNEVSDLTLTSQTPIRSLQASEWLSGSLNASWISNLLIRGDFGANIKLDGVNCPGGVALKKAVVKGTVSSNFVGSDSGWAITGNCGTIEIANSDNTAYAEIDGDVRTLKATGNRNAGLSAKLSGGWVFDSIKTIKADEISDCYIETNGSIDANIADIGSITIKSWLDISSITSPGNIGTIKAGGIRDCIDSGIETGGTIGRVEITGIRNEVYCYINSQITASQIGTAIVSYPKYNNGDVEFGLKTNSIEKFTLKDSSQKTTWLDPNLSTDPIIIDDFKVTLP